MKSEAEVPDVSAELALAFAPLHKRAFGLALGVTMGTLLFAATGYCVVRPGFPAYMYLLANYFPGYTVSWGGAIKGALWAMFTFFMAGWFFAFSRNLVVAASIWVLRTRAELHRTADFLDHI